MEITGVYKCLSDLQRLRILNILQAGPLCVCHIMEILAADQVKISKQLKYMKELKMLEAQREANWMIYRLMTPPNPLLLENLKCLQDLAGDELSFNRDLTRRKEIMLNLQKAPERSPATLLESEDPSRAENAGSH